MSSFLEAMRDYLAEGPPLHEEPAPRQFYALSRPDFIPAGERFAGAMVHYLLFGPPEPQEREDEQLPLAEAR